MPWGARSNYGHFLLDDEIVRARHAVFPSSMDHNLHRPGPEVTALREAQLARTDAASEPGVRLYLTRRGDTKRRFDGEVHLERQLEAEGYLLVDPSTLTVTEQVRLFRGASVVVGATGAAFANIVYAPHTSLVVEIQPELLQGIWVRNLCLLLGIRFRPYFVTSQPPQRVLTVGGLPRPELGQTFEVDVDDFMSWI